MARAKKIPPGQAKKASLVQAKKEPPGQAKKWEEVENAIKDMESTIKDSMERMKKDIEYYADNLLVGAIAAFATRTPPEGWLLCDGKEYSTQEYSRLQHRLSPGDIHAPTFHVPDLRRRFIIGTANTNQLGRYARHVYRSSVRVKRSTTRDSFHAHHFIIPTGLLKSTACLMADPGVRNQPRTGEHMVLKYFIKY